MSKNNPKIFAIVGATCSGKSALALQLAPLLNAFIFSLDSLCIYKDINIASAKPLESELKMVRHFAIDILSPDEHVSAYIFLQLLHDSILECKNFQKNLLIIGGSSFYLKAIMQGLSPMPNTSLHDNKDFISIMQQPLQTQYNLLMNIDSIYAQKISMNDSYRIQKALEIFFQTSLPPTQFFIQNPPIPFNMPIYLYNIVIEKKLLHENIAKRTSQMIANGIMEEAERLLKDYGDTIQPFKSIGPKECLMVLKHKMSLHDLEENITTHTRQLAKRQNTFNRTQFKNIIQICYPFCISTIAKDMLKMANLN